MSWEDQGRQEHGWFGHGGAPSEAGEGGSIERSGPDGASSADQAAARAYAWAKRYGPALFGLPRSGVALDAFADAVTRLERARPGSLARVLGEGGAARDEDAAARGLVTPASDTTRHGGYSMPPFADALPSSPEAQAFAHSVEHLVERAVRAAEGAIGRVFNSEGQGGDTSDPPVPNATPGRRTRGPSILWEKPGGMAEADADFDAKHPENVQPIPGGGRAGDLPDGRRIVVRPESSDERPTLEIQDGRKRIKVRYGA